MKRTKEEAAETRERIFKAAISVFARKGYAGASLSDIAKEAGVTRGAIYWHFENKGALFAEIMARIDRYHEELVLERTIDTAPFQDQLRDVVKELVVRQVDDPEWRVMQEILIRDYFNRQVGANELAAGWTDDNMRGDAAAEAFFDEAIRNHKIVGFSDGYTALLAISCFIAGWIMQVMSLTERPTDGQIDELVSFAVRGFCCRYDKEEGKK